MIEQVSYWISSLSIYVIVLPIAIGLCNFRHLEVERKAILAIVLLSALTEYLAGTLRDRDMNQNLVYYLYTALEFSLLVFVYRRYLGNVPRAAAILLFSFVLLSDLIWWSGSEQFNGYSTAVEALIIIAFAVTYFFVTLQDLRVRYLEKDYLFWVSTGVLLYFASSLFIFLYTNYVAASTRTLFIIWGIHGIFNVLHYIFYSIALWVSPNR